MPFLVNRKAIVAVEIYESIRDRLETVEAYRWMLSACPTLDGMSPIQALKVGREADVRAAARELRNAS